jgi:hypothetical protein
MRHIQVMKRLVQKIILVEQMEFRRCIHSFQGEGSRFFEL